VFDWAVLVVVAVPAAVVGLICAASIAVTSRGPVFFWQERIGRQAQPFRICKFRTMVDEPAGNPLVPDPKYITRVGTLLRRFSLDELPQLLNVARGEMSIVGPRPTLAYQVARYTTDQARRLLVNPGLTGLAQVSGRNAITWSARIVLDLEYVERQSASFDFKLLFRTGLAVARGGGVTGHSEQDPLARTTKNDP